MYDREKFLRYIASDAFLKFIWNGYLKTMSAAEREVMLEAMFNTYVLDSSSSLREYDAA